MYDFQTILARQVGANTVMDFAVAFGLFVLLLIVFKIFEKVIVANLRKLSRKTETELDDDLLQVIESVSGLFYFVLAIYFPLKRLVLGEMADKVIDAIFIIVLTFQVVVSVQQLIDLGLKRFAKSKDVSGKEAGAAFYGLKILIKIVLWVTGLLLVLSNLGFNINSLVASLGIGGVAVALAVQNILGDIFSSFSIYFDKPFQVGDFIVVGQDKGTVKKIGLKTTRLLSLQGEEVVIPNKELTGARVQNFKKMKERRVVFTIGVVYETAAAQLKKVNELVRKVIDGQEQARFDRVHFFQFGPYSLNFEVVYYVLSNEYLDYMNVQQEINFGIKEAFEKAKIEMAFPTQTVKVEKG